MEAPEETSDPVFAEARVEVGFLSAQLEAEWDFELFLTRANTIGEKLDFPAWKIHETAESLQLIFHRLMHDGNDFDRTLSILDNTVRSICE